MNAAIAILIISAMAIVLAPFFKSWRLCRNPHGGLIPGTVEMVHVQCRDCPTQLLVSKTNVIPGYEFSCIECWKAKNGYQPEPEQQLQQGGV